MKNWWKELGKWQVLVVVCSLMTYFATWYFFNNKTIAFIAVSIAILLTTFIMIINNIGSLIVRASVAVAIAATASVLITSIGFFVPSIIVISVAFVAVVILAGATITFVDSGKLNEKIIRFSYAMEFIFIFIPILISILY